MLVYCFAGRKVSNNLYKDNPKPLKNSHGVVLKTLL